MDFSQFLLDINGSLKHFKLLSCISKASFRLMRWPAPNAPPVQPVLMSQAFTLCLAILEWIWVDWATTTWNITVRCAETKLVKWRRWRAEILRKLEWAKTDTAKDGESKAISTQSKSKQGRMWHMDTYGTLWYLTCECSIAMQTWTQTGAQIVIHFVLPSELLGFAQGLICEQFRILGRVPNHERRTEACGESSRRLSYTHLTLGQLPLWKRKT